MKQAVRAVFIFVFALAADVAFADTENIDMFTGEVRVLGTFQATRIAIGNGKIIRLEAREGGELILIGEAAGSSSLRLWLEGGEQRDFNIRVADKDPQTRIRMETMIRMNVKMIEVRKSALTDIGIEWSSVLNGPSATVAGDFISSSLFRGPAGSSGIESNLPLRVRPFSTHFGLATSITSQINLLASGGDAVILAEPTLSCINGGNANFLAGGEVPYPVTGSNGQTSVDFKEYGVKLDISPSADAEGNIYTKILTEISQIDSAVTVLGAPGLLTRRAETEVNVVSGQTIVVSGLLSKSSSEDVNKVPFLGDIPFLGRLFQSTNTSNQETELVIFVTPEVVNADEMDMNGRESKFYEFGRKQSDQARERIDLQLMD